MQQLIKSIATGLLALGSLSAHATAIDLTTAGATGTDGTVRYTQTVDQPTGTGFIDTFVQLQNNGTEQAYNTTVNGVYNNGSPDNFNHQIQVGDVGFIDMNGSTPGGQVMRFFLDLNESSGQDNPLLNLDEVQIFVSSLANQSIEPALAQGQLVPFSGNAQLVYQLDAGGVDDTVRLNYDLNKGGSGKGDMFMDVPLDLFQAAFASGGAFYDTVAEQNNAYIYLYSRFSNADAGFEEWTYKAGSPLTPPGQVPEPFTTVLLVIGLLGMCAVRRRI